jgi:hypothetical protein
LQLEFKAISLQDIKQEISGFNSNETVWSAMEKLKGNVNRSEEFERLMAAFYQYKK